MSSTEKLVGRNKIEAWGLGKQIYDMLTDGFSAKKIHEKLQEKGYALSYPSVARWIKGSNSEIQESIRATFSDHIQKNLPTDLKALEELESISLEWSKENKKTFSQKVITQRIEALTKIFEDDFRKQFIKTKPGTKETRSLIQTLLRFSIDLVNDEISHRKFRLTAGKQALSVIGTKLTFSGILEGAGSGNIIIKGYEEKKRKPIDNVVKLKLLEKRDEEP